MKLPCITKPLFLLGLVGLSIMLFAKNIDLLFGGHDNCFICTKINFNGYLTNWTTSHFIVFAISGYLCPKNVYMLITIGILWEIVELFFEYTSKINNKGFLCNHIMPNCDKKTISKKEFWDHYLGVNNHDLTLFWCSGGMVGSILDIIADTLGVFLGSYLAKM